jgi:cytochrome P450
MMRMRKLDSFIKEVLRYNTPARCSHYNHSESYLVGSKRKVMKPFTFADGLSLSPGEILVAPQGAIHMDEDIYPSPHQFDGFRFSRMREESETAKHYTVNTSTEFLTFGHGKHAWYNPIFAILVCV